jgi:hypothetical protein
MVLFGNCCFQVILTACSLHAYRLSTRVMLHVCVYNAHARSSADSFAVGSGVCSVFVMFSLAYFGTQKRYSEPEGLTTKYFSRENCCVYSIRNEDEFPGREVGWSAKTNSFQDVEDVHLLGNLT